jgi:hypothetical protein
LRPIDHRSSRRPVEHGCALADEQANGDAGGESGEDAL